MRKWIIRVTALFVVLIVTVLFVATPSRQIIMGWLAGNPFYQGRPPAYWREVVLAEDTPRHLSPVVDFLDQIGVEIEEPDPIPIPARDPAAVAVLVFLLRDADPQVREKVAIPLASCGRGSSEAVAALIAALGDDQPGVRISAAYGLATLGSEAEPAVDALMECLRHEHHGVRGSALNALGRVGPSANRRYRQSPAFLAMRGCFFGCAAESLRRINPNDDVAEEAILKLLNEENPTARCLTLHTLGDLPATPRAITAVSKLLQDDVAHVRFEAAAALKKLDPEAAIRAGVD